jgi:hypothetical protein
VIILNRTDGPDDSVLQYGLAVVNFQWFNVSIVLLQGYNLLYIIITRQSINAIGGVKSRNSEPY